MPAEALARAQIAFTHGEEVANKTPEPGIPEMMSAAIMIQNDLECAESIVAPLPLADAELATIRRGAAREPLATYLRRVGLRAARRFKP